MVDVTSIHEPDRVMTLVEWRTIHRMHGTELTAPFPDLSSEWHQHFCPCGSSLITLTPEALSARSMR